MAVAGSATQRIGQQAGAPETALPFPRDEFRHALREEIEAARRTASGTAVEVLSGRKIATQGRAFRYQLAIDSPLNLPDDSPADLIIPGYSDEGRIEATIVSVSGLTVHVSVAVDLGDVVGRARMQPDLTFLLRTLIGRLEEIGEAANPAGDRLLGLLEPSGDTESFEHDGLNPEQREAVGSGLGRDLTVVWCPPGTGGTGTLGTLATELHRRGRSVLLVSRSNAAVDEALLRVTLAASESELARGRVVRLGQSEEHLVANTPELLVETRVQRRSAALVEERERLHVEQEEWLLLTQELDRLIAIAEWLPGVDTELERARADVARHDDLTRTAEEFAGRHDAAAIELAPWLSLNEDAATAVADAERVALLREELPQAIERVATLDAELPRSWERRVVAEELAREAEAHDAAVRAARERLLVGELNASIEEAEALLARAEETTALTRRLRGLPDPAQQRIVVERLRDRHARLGQAHEQTAEQLAQQNLELQEAERTIAEWGHLPDPLEAGERVRALLSEDERLRNEASAASQELHRLALDVRALGEPLERFRQVTDGREAHEVIARVTELHALLAPLAAELAERRQEIADVRTAIERSLVARCRQLVAWQLLDDIGDDFPALAEALAAAADRGRAELDGRAPESLRGDRQLIRVRLGKIEGRLHEIANLLEKVEKRVVADASVVATTLTRACEQESVQARTFDTVILDEASLTPIPALWVLAAKAEKSVVLAGDFMQLPPITHAQHELAEKWLGRDIFEAAGVKGLFDDKQGRPGHLVALREQRGMHPDICAISNQFVYRRQLRDAADAGDDVLDGWFNHRDPFDNPVVLVDTSKLDAWVSSVDVGGRFSRLNVLSAAVCVDIAQMLLRDDREPFQPGQTPRVLLAAPYRPHARLLSLLANEQARVGEVVAGTPQTFQGIEAPALVFDLVNDEPQGRVGMFSERMEEETKRLLNVALTRAQQRLVVVGDFRWIESRAKRSGTLARLIAYLKDHHPVADAGELLLAGFAARAPQLVVTQDQFFEHLSGDLAGAQSEVVIYSPFMTRERVGRLEPQLRAAVERGADSSVVTRSLEERSRSDHSVYAEIENDLRGWGVHVVHKRGMHEKLVLIDETVLWQGSLNPLSSGSSREIMERRVSSDLLAEYRKVLRLDDLLNAYRAYETVCPYCGAEVVAAEGSGEPFYWRCVEDSCFTRSIGDPIPLDGRVVCRSCGAPVEFRWPNDAPFWRCTANYGHRQPVARTHLRMPNMRDLIPGAQLPELERHLDVRQTDQMGNS
jgi:hypothetical protein